jgi:four helix bundle protein
MSLDHERLDVYQLALGVARWAAAEAPAIPAQREHLRDQLVRAADSVVLNIAEGAGNTPGSDARRNHDRIARGSAAEAAAVLDLAALPGGVDRQHELRRVVAMLTRLSKR